MADRLTPDEKNEALFLQLVIAYHTAALQQLGKVKNPVTDKVERNFEQARFFIDTIDMLKAKTQGNLSEKESRFIEDVLGELKLTFVTEMDRQQKEKAQASTRTGD